MTFIISIGSKSNKAPLSSLGTFVGLSFSNNIAVGCFRKIGSHPSNLGCSGFQLHHMSMGAVPEPSDAILGAGFH